MLTKHLLKKSVYLACIWDEKWHGASSAWVWCRPSSYSYHSRHVQDQGITSSAGSQGELGKAGFRL